MYNIIHIRLYIIQYVLYYSIYILYTLYICIIYTNCIGYIVNILDICKIYTNIINIYHTYIHSYLKPLDEQRDKSSDK